MQMYDLPEDQWFVSHGNTVKTAPDTIAWTADSFATALDDAHLMNIGLQTKLLCKFNDPVGDDYSGSNSIYQGQYTLWFKVEQHSAVIDDCDADGKNCVTSKSSMWTGALKDNEDGSSPGWNPPSESGVKACPFLFIYAGDGARCTVTFLRPLSATLCSAAAARCRLISTARTWRKVGARATVWLPAPQ